MISETTVEKVINIFENDPEGYMDALAALMDSQSALFAFLSQESNDVLTEQEKDIMWYIVLVIVSSFQEEHSMHSISDVELGNNEERNWDLYQQQSKSDFRNMVTVFFEDYDQEDLLAFVEDVLVVEEDSPITTVGREVIFISSKSVIDSLENK